MHKRYIEGLGRVTYLMLEEALVLGFPVMPEPPVFPTGKTTLEVAANMDKMIEWLSRQNNAHTHKETRYVWDWSDRIWIKNIEVCEPPVHDVQVPLHRRKKVSHERKS